MPPPSKTEPATVVLLHGIYMHGLFLAPLARQLRKAGYRTLVYSYASLRYTAADNARELFNTVRTLPATRVHFVAHSLGGLVVRHLFARVAKLPPGRVVTLGTPHQGSAVAARLSGSGLHFVLGQSDVQALLGDAPLWPGDRELGSLAGTLNAGMGRLLVSVPSPADGTVAVSETCLPGMRDHICLPVSHTGMLYATSVAEQILYFIARGCFRH